MNIAAVELEPWEAEILKQAFPTISTSAGHLAEAQGLAEVEALIVFIYSRITTDVLATMPKLKMIATMSTGYDHIDLAACAARGIVVCNVPSYGESTVAEQTFALLLALTRKIVPSVNRTRQGDFRLTDLRGVDLSGKTFGVVGTGRIGQHVIRIAHGFGMKVLGYDLRPQTDLAIQLGFTYVPLDELLAQSDVVSLHAPATPETEHLMNEERLMTMKPGAFLINTARGSLIETKDLVKVLDAGHLAGVGLDVLEEEHDIHEERELLSTTFQSTYDLKTTLANHVLLSHPRVLITPHNAFNTREALERILATTVENIKAWQAEKAVNVVSK